MRQKDEHVVSLVESFPIVCFPCFFSLYFLKTEDRPCLTKAVLEENLIL